MKKYECEADYTITYVKQEIIEADSWEKAEDTFHFCCGYFVCDFFSFGGDFILYLQLPKWQLSRCDF